MAATALNQFTKKLYGKLATQKGENVFISPYSISTALAMCYFGARNETAQQLKDLLELSHLSDAEILDVQKRLLTHINEKLGGENAVVITTANKVYSSQSPADPTFLDIVKNNFKSEVEQISFSNPQKAADTINKWVSDKTRDKIQDLISPDSLDDLTKMVLVNAIYFKGLWRKEFDPSDTRKREFRDILGNIHSIDMMHFEDERLNFQTHPGGIPANACSFPYLGGKVVMTIILPEEGHSIEELESKLTGNLLNSILTAHESMETVRVALPKFKLEIKYELNGPLKELGAVLPFDQNRADFSKIAQDVHISSVVHKAVVEVNEKGTEAAAATGIAIRAMCMPMPTKEFICDRPFLFVIHELDHGTALFLGKFAKLSA